MTRAPSTIALALTTACLLVLGCTACSERRTEPNEVDAERLAALEAAPPFDAAEYDAQWTAHPAAGEWQSINALAERGRISIEFPVSPAGASTPAEDPWGDTFPLAVALLEEMRADGWEPVAVACTPPEEADPFGTVGAVEFSAQRDDGELATMAQVRIGGVGEDAAVQAEAETPFHTEANDPWAATPIDGPTCLDAEAPPTAPASDGAPPTMGRVPVG